MIKYKVVWLEPEDDFKLSMDTYTEQLNIYASRGWRVVTSYALDYLILEKELDE